MSIEADFLVVLDHMATSWRRMAIAQEASLEIAEKGIALQEQMAKSSRALESALKKSAITLND
jgi:hypothetical protein